MNAPTSRTGNGGSPCGRKNYNNVTLGKVSGEVRYKSNNRFQVTVDNFDWNDYNVGSNLQNVNQFR